MLGGSAMKKYEALAVAKGIFGENVRLEKRRGQELPFQVSMCFHQTELDEMTLLLGSGESWKAAIASARRRLESQQ